MATVKLTSKGQITLPKVIRDHLGLKAGDRIEFLIGPDEAVIVKPKEWVRHTIETALDPSGKAGAEAPDPLTQLASLDAPTGDIEQMLAEIEAGRRWEPV